MPVAVKRIYPTILSLAVLLPACSGGPGEDASEPIGEPTPIIAIDEPDYLPWSGGVPVWDLPPDETAEIATGIYTLLYGNPDRAYAPVRDRCGDLRSTDTSPELISGHPQLERCLRPYLEERGVSTEALDLLFSTGIVVLEVVGDTPVIVVEGQDLDLWGSSGIHSAFVFTPGGIVDVAAQIRFDATSGWQSMLDALATAHAQPAIVAARRADGAATPPIAFQIYGETMYLGTPVETEFGWSIPLAWEARSCHACAVPLVGRFALDATPEGDIAGMRFVDLCYLTDFEPRDDSEAALVREGEYGLAGCTVPDRHLG